MASLTEDFVALRYGDDIARVDPEFPDLPPKPVNGRRVVDLDLNPHFTASSLKLSTQQAGGELGAILALVKWECHIEGKDGFTKYFNDLAVLAASHAVLRARKSLDFIEHAQQGNVMSIGGVHGVSLSADWLDDHDDLSAALQRMITAGVIGSIRLLGCRTGCDVGFTNLVELEKLFGIEVWGTTRTIDHRDFAPGGWSATQGLISSRGAACPCQDNPPPP